jgi:hypothetical protein
MGVRSSPARFRTSRRSNLGFNQAIARLRNGAVLTLQYVRGKPVWELGSFDVAPEVAALLVDDGEIEPAGDALFVDAPSQTWRAKTK